MTQLIVCGVTKLGVVIREAQLGMALQSNHLASSSVADP